MQHRDPSPPPGDRARRRSLFGGRSEPGPTYPTGLTPSAAERAEAVVTAYQETIQEQLDEGLRAIQHTANSLMHEIASEVWRSAGGDKGTVGATILHELSRDQAIRALIAHADERFQALATRTGRLEDTMNKLAESVRSAREQIARSADVLADSDGPPLGTTEIRSQLDEVTRQVAVAFRTLAERDQVLVDAMEDRIRQHGELVTQETARISAAMQEYVQQGVEAMGQLAGSTDSRVRAISDLEGEITERMRHTVEQSMAELGEQLQLLYDRTAIAMTSLHESVGYLGDRLGIETSEAFGELNRGLETKVLGLANLVRSDSEALRRELVRTAEVHDRAMAQAMDERLGRVVDTVSETVSETVRLRMAESVAELSARSDEQSRHIEARGEEQDRLIRTLGEQQVRLIEARMDETVSSIDRNVIRMADALESHVERLGDSVGERMAQAADVAIGARFDDVTARLHAASDTIERAGVEARAATERTVSRIDEAGRTIEERQGAFGNEVAELLDQRIASLAKLVRSDNETLAQQIVADQDASKQALRAMKELQASLPAEVIQMVEERFASLAESIERSNEMLAARIDRMADTIGQRQNDDIQVVIDRMGDAMHALASLGKGDATGGTGRRIQID
jgi:ABC-type transporter Mla subunit MlaD